MDLDKLHSALLEDLSVEDSRSIRADMQELFDSRGYKVLAQYLETYYRSEIAGIAGTPLADSSQVYQQEFRKGVAAGLLMVLQLPENLIQFCESNIQSEHFSSQQETDRDGWETELV